MAGLLAVLMLPLVIAQCLKDERSVVWNLTENKTSLEFQLTEAEELTIVAMGIMPITMSFDEEDQGILCSDAEGLTMFGESLENCSSPGIKPFQPHNLIFNQNNSTYEILANGKKLMTAQMSNAQQKAHLTLTANLVNLTSSVHITYRQIVTPVTQPAASSLVVVLTAALVVSLTMLIVAIICIVLLRLQPSGFLTVWVLGRPSTFQTQCSIASTNQKVDDTVPLPRLPPRPTEASPTTIDNPLKVIEDRYNHRVDPEDDYIIAREVKPVEVEVLKQQKVIQGKVFH